MSCNQSCTVADVPLSNNDDASRKVGVDDTLPASREPNSAADVAVELCAVTSTAQWYELLHPAAPIADSGDARVVHFRVGAPDSGIRAHLVGRGEFLRSVRPFSTDRHSGSEWMFEVKADARSSPHTAAGLGPFDAFLLDVCRKRGPEYWEEPAVASVSNVVSRVAPPASASACAALHLHPMVRTYRSDHNNTPAYVPLVALNVPEADNAPLIQVRDRQGLLLWPSSEEDGTGAPRMALSMALDLCRLHRHVEYTWAFDGISFARGARYLMPFGVLTTLRLLDFDYAEFKGTPASASSDASVVIRTDGDGNATVESAVATNEVHLADVADATTEVTTPAATLETPD